MNMDSPMSMDSTSHHFVSELVATKGAQVVYVSLLSTFTFLLFLTLCKKIPGWVRAIILVQQLLKQSESIFPNGH
ncbi:hypothetical protein GQ53DRAFT_745836 [Thozetella sp. PMI_491]|nr:hypothetical protein GQ53DRAFT_745836 [Thozetella sp. PMI_491]